MYETFNRNFQNIMPNQDETINPYGEQYFGENDKVPYIEGMNNPLPGYMNNMPFPLEPSLSTPNLDTQVTVAPQANYAKGGKIQKKKKKVKMTAMKSLAEMIRQQGEGNDTILAHINPEEARMLKEMGGSGTINPITGLPQFGFVDLFFNKPFKAIKSVVGGGAGAVIGNMIAPGIGGIIGGALGQGLQHKARGKDPLQGALKGAGMGALLPTGASLLGSGASNLGMEGAGGFLSKYGAENAIMPSLGRLIGNNSVGNYVGSIGQGSSSSLSPLIAGVSAGEDPDKSVTDYENDYKKEYYKHGTNYFKDQERLKNRGWGEKIIDSLAEPQNLLTAGVLASSLLGQKSARKKGLEQAKEDKAYREAMKLTEPEMLAEEQMKRRVERQKFLPEERLGNIEPVYRKTHTPEEYKKYGRWLSYYNNPEMRGEPIPYKKGGKVPVMEFEEEEMDYPQGLGFFLKGQTAGQDDKIPALLSDGEYVIPADVVSHAGDGNNMAGAKKFDELLKNIRKHKGGSIKLPPKAKSLASYMR